MTPGSPVARFPSTAWTCIQAARDPDHPHRVAAVNRLIETYWRCVFHYLRARGHAFQKAEDLTQAFFLRFLERGWLGRVDPARGRFRNYLRTLLKGFVCDQTVRASLQVQFERSFVSIASLIQDSDRTYEPADQETGEEAFDKQWKDSVLATVRRSLQLYYEGTGKVEDRLRFQIFAAYHFAERASEQPTQEQLAERFGVTREQVRYALEEVGKRYKRFLRQEIRDQVGSEEEIDQELAALL